MFSLTITHARSVVLKTWRARGPVVEGGAGLGWGEGGIGGGRGDWWVGVRLQVSSGASFSRK